MKTHTLDFTELELSVILKSLKVSKFYFEDSTRTKVQDEIETNIISDLEDLGIHTYNHSV